MSTEPARTIILVRGQDATGRRTPLRGYPYQVDLGAAVINLDQASALAAYRALRELVVGAGYDRDEPAGGPLPAGVTGFRPYSTDRALPPLRPATPAAVVFPARDFGDPSYRTDRHQP